MVFHWSLSDSKSPQVSRTLLGILAVLNNVTKVIDTLIQENFNAAFQKFLERFNKCIAAGGDYFEGEWSFMCVLSIKVPIRKKSGNLSYAIRIFCRNYCIKFFLSFFLCHRYIITSWCEHLKLWFNLCRQ